MDLKKVKAPNLLCACQGEDDGMISISFYYGLEGMGKRTPVKVIFPAIGTTVDAFEDIKEKLNKIAKKVCKRQKKKSKTDSKPAENYDNESPGDPPLPNEGECEAIDLEAIDISSFTIIEDGEKSDIEDTDGRNSSNDDSSTKDAPDDGSNFVAPVESDTVINHPTMHNVHGPAEAAGHSTDQECHKAESNHEDYTKKVNLCIKYQDKEITAATSNAEAWRNDHYFVIDICGVIVQYAICVNPARVKSIELPKNMMNGFMVYPNVHLENCELQMCQFSWYKCKKKPKNKMGETYKQIFLALEEGDTDQDKKMFLQNSTDDKANTNRSSEWSFVHSGFVYEPTENDIDYFLKVTCDVSHLFVDQEAYIPCEYAESKHVVRKRPGICPFEKRQLDILNRAKTGSFRIMTYNILADMCANTRSAVNYFYAYCAPYALSLDYRKQLFMKEILGYKCDVICLQEVDQKVYHNDLETILTRNGYSGEMRTRCKSISQGETIYYKTDKFIKIGSHHVELTSLLREGNVHKDILQKISSNEMLQRAFEERLALLMVTALQPVGEPDKVLLVANTHLTCGARKANLRILQSITALKHLEYVMETFYKEKDASIVFCGDFNSLPESGVVSLITKSEVSEKHADWFVGGRDEFVSGMSLKTNLQLQTAYTNPYYTNYVSGFYGTIDYIFHDQEKLELTSVVPLPEHSEVIQDTACPSIKFPSDHLSLVCDLKFVN